MTEGDFTEKTEYGYTKEQINEIKEEITKNDFTKNLTLNYKPDYPKGYESIFTKCRKFFKVYWQHDLIGLNIKRNMNNFSKDHPINFLQTINSNILSSAIARIYSDEKKMDAYTDKFFDMYMQPIKAGLKGYAKQLGKPVSKLNEDEKLYVINKVADVINEELIKVVMIGQKVPEIFNIFHKNKAHEDYRQKLSNDKINFIKQWEHTDTKIGRLLSLDKEYNNNNENEDFDIADRQNIFSNSRSVSEIAEANIIYDEFLKSLNGIDYEIVKLAEKGYTMEEIAESLNYKNHSAISKRIKKIKLKYLEFTESKK